MRQYLLLEHFNMTVSDFPTRVGFYIKRAREEVGLTQQELSLRTGLSRVTISHLENGLRKQVKPELIKRISVVLGKKSDYFFGIEEETGNICLSDLPNSLSDAIGAIMDLPKAEQEKIGNILKQMLIWRDR